MRVGGGLNWIRINLLQLLVGWHLGSGLYRQSCNEISLCARFQFGGNITVHSNSRSYNNPIGYCYIDSCVLELNPNPLLMNSEYRTTIALVNNKLMTPHPHPYAYWQNESALHKTRFATFLLVPTRLGLQAFPRAVGASLGISPGLAWSNRWG